MLSDSYPGPGRFDPGKLYQPPIMTHPHPDKPRKDRNGRNSKHNARLKLSAFRMDFSMLPDSQGLVKGAELCLNPYFFGWLKK